MRKSRVFLSMTGIFLVTSAVFLFTFFNQQKELTGAVQQAINNNAPPKFSQVFYGGFGEDALDKPMDISVIGQFIYVTDTNNKRIQVFDLAGTQVFKFGKQGDKPGEFQFPYGITGDSQGNVYVADLYLGCISVHDLKGKFIRYFGEKNPKEKVIEAPGSIRMVKDKMYVTDIMKSKVMVFDINGKKLLELGQVGTKPSEFRAPNGITADNDGNIYVVDTANQRVQVFDPKGKFLRSFNGSTDGKGASVFVNPRGIAVDSRGIVYVVSNLTHYIYGYDKDGKEVFVFGGSGEANDKFSLPNGLFVDQNDQVYITDTMNRRIAIYN